MIIVSIIRYSFFVYSLYKLNKNRTENNIKYVNVCAHRCGPLAIKLLQFIIMRNVEFSKMNKMNINFVLEDCNQHTFAETEKMYFEEYNRSIHSDYIFESNCVIGSGSIGQVYKAYCKKRNEYIAIKVKHPCMDINVNSMVYALKIICFFLRPINKFHNVIMEYINGIHLQIDYTQEANNTIKLRNYFKNETCIVIPEIISYSKNFIFMTYHQGKAYEQVSEKSQMISSMYMNFFYITSLVVYDFLHSDLHYGNWKVIENENNDVQLLIYDCGIMCSTGNIEINKEVLENAMNRRNFMKIVDIIKRLDPSIVINKNHIEQLNDTIRFDLSSSECLTLFFNKLIELQLLKDKNLIRILTSIAIIGEAPSKSISAITKYIYSQLESNTILYHIHLGLLKKINNFSDLIKHYENEIELNKNYKEQYSDWLFEEFGHRKANILDSIIYNKFFN